MLLTTDTMSSAVDNVVSDVSVGETSITTAVSGTISRAPVIAVGAVPSGVTNAASGAATTTAPNSGVYVMVSSPKNTATATATISTVTAGYTDGTNYVKTQGTKAGGAAASAATYIPIKTGSATTPTTTVYTGTSTLTVNNSNGYVSAPSVSKGTSLTPTVTEGYIKSGTAGTVTATFNASGLQLPTLVPGIINGVQQDNIYITPSTSAQTVMDKGCFLAANHIIVNAVSAGTLAAGSAAVLNNSNGNIRYYRNVTAAGYIAVNNTAYYLQLNTKAGGTTTITGNTKLINAGQFAIGDIYATVTAGTLAAGSAAVLNNANGNIRYYRNVTTAGYIAANTTAYYLQLNTKAGGTTTITGNTKIVNAGQFVIGDMYATVASGSASATPLYGCDGRVINASNHAVDVTDKIALTTEANNRYKLHSLARKSTTAGYIASSSVDSYNNYFINKSGVDVTYYYTPDSNFSNSIHIADIDVYEGYLPE